MHDAFASRRALPLAGLVVLALVAPPAAAEPPAARTFLEGQLGAIIPAATWPANGPDPVEGHDGDRSYAYLMAPAFLGGLHFGHLFAIGSGPACCLIGPEAGWDYATWEADSSLVTPDPYGYGSQALSGLRQRLLVAMRVAAVWDWGAFLLRFGLGPEIVDMRYGDYGESNINFGGFFLGGTGISFHIADWFAFTILASFVVDVHSGSAGTGYYYDYEESYFDFKALEVEVLGGATFYI